MPSKLRDLRPFLLCGEPNSAYQSKPSHHSQAQPTPNSSSSTSTHPSFSELVALNVLSVALGPRLLHRRFVPSLPRLCSGLYSNLAIIKTMTFKLVTPDASSSLSVWHLRRGVWRWLKRPARKGEQPRGASKKARQTMRVLTLNQTVQLSGQQ